MSTLTQTLTKKETKLGQDRAEEAAPTKLDDQHNTLAMPVRTRTMWLQSPRPRRAPRTARSPYSSSPRDPTNLAEKAAVHKPGLAALPA